MTPDRFERYMANKKSDSMMDHYFDKLLHVAIFKKDVIHNDYLVEEAARRVDPLVQICLKWGKSGKIPLKTIYKHAKECGIKLDDDDEDDSIVAKPQTSAKSRKTKVTLKLGLLRKQIRRKQLVRGLTLKHLKQRVVKPQTVSAETQTYEVNKKFEAPVPKKKVIKNYYKEQKRRFTTTLVVPSSIVDNAQSLELKTYLVGQIAKAAAMFCFNEVVIVSCDKTKQMKMMQDLTTTEFFVQNMEYLETPQYLRKALFPKSPALRFAGLMNPLDTPHHLRATQWGKYREGVVMNRPSKDNKGSWVNIGLTKDCQIDLQLQEGTRVTVMME